MHQNVFGGRSSPGPTGGALALLHTCEASRCATRGTGGGVCFAAVNKHRRSQGDAEDADAPATPEYQAN